MTSSLPGRHGRPATTTAPAAATEPSGRRRARVGSSHTRGTRRCEAGAVTAETAVALPVLACTALSLAWVVTLGATEVRALDAAREVARAAARSDGSARALELGRRVAPAGSTVRLSTRGGEVVAHVTSPVGPPLGLLGSWAVVDLHASAVAAKEPGS